MARDLELILPAFLVEPTIDHLLLLTAGQRARQTGFIDDVQDVGALSPQSFSIGSQRYDVRFVTTNDETGIFSIGFTTEAQATAFIADELTIDMGIPGAPHISSSAMEKVGTQALVRSWGHPYGNLRTYTVRIMETPEPVAAGFRHTINVTTAQFIGGISAMATGRSIGSGRNLAYTDPDGNDHVVNALFNSGFGFLDAVPAGSCSVGELPWSNSLMRWSTVVAVRPSCSEGTRPADCH